MRSQLSSTTQALASANLQLSFSAGKVSELSRQLSESLGEQEGLFKEEARLRAMAVSFSKKSKTICTEPASTNNPNRWHKNVNSSRNSGSRIRTGEKIAVTTRRK